MKAAEEKIARWALASFPERGLGDFVVDAAATVGGGSAAGAFWHGLASYFVARPFVRALQRAVSHLRDDGVAVSIEAQEIGARLWHEYGEEFLRHVYAASDDGAILFPDIDPDVVREWATARLDAR